MRFEQTRTILKYLAPAYHHSVGDYFQALAEGNVSPRVALMLDYLVDHERHRALALAEFCRDASHHLLDQWCKGVEINFPHARPEVIEDGARNDLDLLMKAAVAYKKTLIDYYNHVVQRCGDDDSRALFEQLKNQEEKAMKRMNPPLPGAVRPVTDENLPRRFDPVPARLRRTRHQPLLQTPESARRLRLGPRRQRRLPVQVGRLAPLR